MDSGKKLFSWASSIAAVALLLVQAPCLSSDDSRLLQRYYDFDKQLQRLADEAVSANRQIDEAEITDLFERSFGADVRSSQSTAFSAAELRLLIKATQDAFFYKPLPSFAEQMKKMAETLSTLGADEHRGILEKTYSYLLVARRFDEASEFAQHAGIDQVEWQVDGGATDFDPARPAVLSIRNDDNGVRLVPRNNSLEKGRRVVAVVHPNCGFSRRAMEVVERDETLQALFRERTTWLASQTHTRPLKPLMDWNVNAKETVVQLVYQEDSWPDHVGFMQTPVFYFLADGELIDTVSGWPDDHQGERLKQAFDRLDDGGR